MIRTRIALLVTLLLTLLPAAIIAQEAEVVFPIAVVALEGSYDAADDGATCELAWESAGTPTLRITSSDGSRFRQDLTGGELATLPDVDDAQACVFVVEAAVPEARRYTVTIEGAELVEIASADLADLEGAIVLPVEMGREGEYGLVTDDYLDIVLDDVDGGLRPVETAPEPEPAPQETEEALPDDTPAPSVTPVPSEHDGKVIDAAVLLFVYEDFTVLTDDRCRVDALVDDAALVAESSSGVFRSKWTPRDSGVPVDAAGSPVGEAGCVFQRTMRLPGADTYTFLFGDEQLAVVPFPDLEAMDGALLLAVDRNGNRTPVEPVTVAVQPDPSATPLSSSSPGSALPEGQHEIVARVNLWLSSPEDAPFGCAAGPTRTGVYPGAQLVVRDAHEVIIGYGTLVYSDRSGATVCSFDVTFVVPEAELYVLELGNGDRYVISRAELELWNWHVFIDAGWQ
jgi:hypothetical protein